MQCPAPCLSPSTRMREHCGTSSGSCATATRGTTASCACGSSHEALACLEDLRGRRRAGRLGPCRAVALRGITGSELLDQAGRLHPHAKRGLLIAWGDWGDRATGEAIFDSIAHGRIDHYVIRPSASPDELFHQAISSLLLEWAEARRTLPYTIHVVGESWSGRAYELRDATRTLRDPALVLPGRLERRARPRRRGGGAGQSCQSSSSPTARS